MPCKICEMSWDPKETSKVGTFLPPLFPPLSPYFCLTLSYIPVTFSFYYPLTLSFCLSASAQPFFLPHHSFCLFQPFSTPLSQNSLSLSTIPPQHFPFLFSAPHQGFTWSWFRRPYQAPLPLCCSWQFTQCWPGWADWISLPSLAGSPRVALGGPAKRPSPS